MAATHTSVERPYVGSSGFSYPSWRPAFYPAGLKPGEFLRFYAERLPAVELNTTFYRLPSEQQFLAWAAQVPDGFRFAVKATRAITHATRLDYLGTFAERVRLLGDRLGPIRIQLPDSRPRDDGLLELFLGSLDPGVAWALDLPHESWRSPEIDARLDAAGVARVGALAGAAAFRYLRLREPPYADDALGELARRIVPLLAEGVHVYCFFRHEDAPTAPRYALRLAELVAAMR